MSTGLDGFGKDLFDGLIDEDGISCCRRGRCCKYEEPTWGDYGGPKGVVAGIYEMNTQESKPFLVRRVRLVHRVFESGTNQSGAETEQ